MDYDQFDKFMEPLNCVYFGKRRSTQDAPQTNRIHGLMEKKLGDLLCSGFLMGCSENIIIYSVQNKTRNGYRYNRLNVFKIYSPE